MRRHLSSRSTRLLTVCTMIATTRNSSINNNSNLSASGSVDPSVETVFPRSSSSNARHRYTEEMMEEGSDYRQRINGRHRRRAPTAEDRLVKDIRELEALHTQSRAMAKVNVPSGALPEEMEKPVLVVDSNLSNNASAAAALKCPVSMPSASTGDVTDTTERQAAPQYTPPFQGRRIQPAAAPWVPSYHFEQPLPSADLPPGVGDIAFTLEELEKTLFTSEGEMIDFDPADFASVARPAASSEASSKEKSTTAATTASISTAGSTSPPAPPPPPSPPPPTPLQVSHTANAATDDSSSAICQSQAAARTQTDISAKSVACTATAAAAAVASSSTVVSTLSFRKGEPSVGKTTAAAASLPEATPLSLPLLSLAFHADGTHTILCTPASVTAHPRDVVHALHSALDAAEAYTRAKKGPTARVNVRLRPAKCDAGDSFFAGNTSSELGSSTSQRVRDAAERERLLQRLRSSWSVSTNTATSESPSAASLSSLHVIAELPCEEPWKATDLGAEVLLCCEAVTFYHSRGRVSLHSQGRGDISEEEKDKELAAGMRFVIGFPSLHMGVLPLPSTIAALQARWDAQPAARRAEILTHIAIVDAESLEAAGDTSATTLLLLPRLHTLGTCAGAATEAQCLRQRELLCALLSTSPTATAKAAPTRLSAWMRAMARFLWSVPRRKKKTSSTTVDAMLAAAAGGGDVWSCYATAQANLLAEAFKGANKRGFAWPPQWRWTEVLTTAFESREAQNYVRMFTHLQKRLLPPPSSHLTAYQYAFSVLTAEVLTASEGEPSIIAAKMLRQRSLDGIDEAVESSAGITRVLVFAEDVSDSLRCRTLAGLRTAEASLLDSTAVVVALCKRASDVSDECRGLMPCLVVVSDVLAHAQRDTNSQAPAMYRSLFSLKEIAVVGRADEDAGARARAAAAAYLLHRHPAIPHVNTSTGEVGAVMAATLATTLSHVDQQVFSLVVERLRTSLLAIAGSPPLYTLPCYHSQHLEEVRRRYPSVCGAAPCTGDTQHSALMAAVLRMRGYGAELAATLPPRVRAQAYVDVVFLSLANSCCELLLSGCVASAADANLISLVALGLSPSTGGVLAVAEDSTGGPADLAELLQAHPQWTNSAALMKWVANQQLRLEQLTPEMLARARSAMVAAKNPKTA